MSERIGQGGERPEDIAARKAAWKGRDTDAEKEASTLNLEDVERLLRAQGMTASDIAQAKRARGTPMP